MGNKGTVEAYWEDESAEDNGRHGGNGRANEPSDHEILEGLWRREAEDKGRSIKHRNIKQCHGDAGSHRNRLRYAFFALFHDWIRGGGSLGRGREGERVPDISWFRLDFLLLLVA